MRGKKAKRLRKEVYGDLSLRARKYRVRDDGSIMADPLRVIYQKLKKEEVK